MTGEACIANIDARGRRHRFRLGVMGLLAAGCLTVAELALGWSALVEVPIALLWFGGFAGVFQARAKT